MGIHTNLGLVNSCMRNVNYNQSRNYETTHW